MKRILFISALFIWTSLNAQVSRDDYLADFDYGVDMVETIYSGFDYKVTDCTRTSYFALKDSLRTAIANNQAEFGELAIYESKPKTVSKDWHNPNDSCPNHLCCYRIVCK